MGPVMEAGNTGEHRAPETERGRRGMLAPERPGVARGRKGARAALPERVTQHCLTRWGRRARARGAARVLGVPELGGCPAVMRRGVRGPGDSFLPVSSSPARPHNLKHDCGFPPQREAPGNAAGGGRAFPRLSERVWEQGAGEETKRWGVGWILSPAFRLLLDFQH